MKKTKWTFQFGVSVFQGRKKVDEIHFKSEKDMVYWLYKNDPLPITPRLDSPLPKGSKGSDEN